MTQPSRKLKFVPLVVTVGFSAIAGLLAAYLILRLFIVKHDNPPVVSEPDWDSPQTRELAKRACFDCHSNETVWPWYSYLPPFAYAMERDVREGRRVLNFSDWGRARGEARSYHEMAEVIQEGEMPPGQYTAMHPNANLTRDERARLLTGLKATLGGGSSASDGGEDEEEHEEEGDDD